MVDPVSDEERQRTVRRAKIALVVLVGASAGLVTTQGDASLAVVVWAVVGGLLVGVVLVWILFPELRIVTPGSNRRSR